MNYCIACGCALHVRVFPAHLPTCSLKTFCQLKLFVRSKFFVTLSRYFQSQYCCTVLMHVGFIFTGRQVVEVLSTSTIMFRQLRLFALCSEQMCMSPRQRLWNAAGRDAALWALSASGVGLELQHCPLFSCDLTVQSRRRPGAQATLHSRL